MKVQIISVIPNYIEGPANYSRPGEVPPKVLGTWNVDLVLVEADGLTYEQACDYLRDQTRFELTPVEE